MSGRDPIANISDAAIQRIHDDLDEQEAQEAIAALAHKEWSRQWQIDRLEALRATDIQEYWRQDGSDRLLRLYDGQD